jgi:NADH-quinone oxidoreductase subunit A
MLEAYLPLLILIIVATLVALIAIGLGYLFGPRRPTKRKSQPYESGMKPYGPGVQRISVRYYLIAVLFILFDVEMIFFLPWVTVFRELGVPGLVGFLMFIGVLMAGFVYALKKGALEWE